MLPADPLAATDVLPSTGDPAEGVPYVDESVPVEASIPATEPVDVEPLEDDPVAADEVEASLSTAEPPVEGEP